MLGDLLEPLPYPFAGVVASSLAILGQAWLLCVIIGGSASSLWRRWLLCITVMVAAGFPALVSLHVHSPAFVLAYLFWTIGASILATAVLATAGLVRLVGVRRG